jgi:hypothetical protein
VSWKQLLILLGPFSIAYFLLLVPRGLITGLFDRYLIPLLFVEVVALLRLFEERVQHRLPYASAALALIFAVFAVAGTHDAFSMFRAEAAAFAEVRNTGIPASAIDGGIEQNGMTQLESVGFMNDPRIRVPTTFRVQPPRHFPKNCEPLGYWLTPAVVPRYALSFDPNACGGQSQFAPVSYRTWLGPSPTSIYIVNAPAPHSAESK